MTIIKKTSSKNSLRASNPTRPNTIGINRTPRKEAILSWKSITLSAHINYGAFRNDGTQKILIRFNNQAPGNFWTIPPGETSPTIRLGQERTELHYKSMGGTSFLECMLWSE